MPLKCVACLQVLISDPQFLPLMSLWKPSARAEALVDFKAAAAILKDARGGSTLKPYRARIDQ
jgi:hypothetical protein